MIGGLVLAAGGGTRFGGPKQIARLGGRPMLELPLRAMAAAPLDRVCVVLGSESDAILGAVDLHGAEPLRCERWAEGQAMSLRTGVEALRDCDAIVVALGDQPFLSAVAVERVLCARRTGTDAVRASYDGAPGHPVVIERTQFEGVAALEGDVGARGLLADARVLDVACDGLGRPDDIDTRDQLARAESRGSTEPRAQATEEAVRT
jgi:CTP:molybdopterin cytidylyltransferase MocA